MKINDIHPEFHITLRPKKPAKMTVENKPLDGIVVGAGIAGLSAAIALGKQSHHVVVCSSEKRD